MGQEFGVAGQFWLQVSHHVAMRRQPGLQPSQGLTSEVVH